MIDSKIPNTWMDLQNEVSKIFIESGFKSESPKIIETVREKVEVDVYAVDISHKPEIVYLCECKHWKRAIPSEIIRSFRSVVTDFGANLGIIISLKGYQAGAFKSIRNTNIKLLNWIQFQELFEERWYENYFLKELSYVNEPLIDYTEPINTRVFRKADLLSQSAHEEFRCLRKKYAGIVFFALSLYAPWESSKPIKLPLDNNQVMPSEEQYDLPLDLFEVVAYRDLKDRNLLLPGAIIAIFCYGCQPNIYPRATLNYIICHEHGLGS
ncbi:MAG: restriction endonuclease, partial [Firmicutes bacterium]|nr:restriction endonuclease [Bacillota bacterium]